MSAKKLKLSKRLEMVAAYVPRGCHLADIGTDHGYVPIYLVSRGLAGHAIAMDVREGPLSRARQHIEQYRLEEQIEVRLSDGLGELRAGEADTVVIAGLGGELLMRIMEEGRHVWDSVGTWVLSPQSELYKVREYLERQGFGIVAETMLAEDGKYYTVMRAGRNRNHLADNHAGIRSANQLGAQSANPAASPAYSLRHEMELRYGKYLLDSRHPVLKCFLEQERRQLETLLIRLGSGVSAAGRQRREELMKLLTLSKEAWNEMQRDHGVLK